MLDPQATVRVLLPVHIASAFAALLAGYFALSATKGARLHRRSGLAFAAAMPLMALTGAWIAFVNASAHSLIAGLLTFYFVVTALRTVRPGPLVHPAWDLAGLVFALAVALLAFRTGLDGLRRGGPEGIAMLIFCAMGLLASAGDARMTRAGGLHGKPRLARHLWRMCFAMWVAATSFFYGPPGRVPELIRYPALYPIPVFAPLVVMLYWLWRLRRNGPAVSTPSAYPPR